MTRARATGKAQDGTASLNRNACIRLISEHFGKSWQEIEPELRSLERAYGLEVEAWAAWRELGAILRRIERIAYADQPLTEWKTARPQAEARRGWREAFPRGLTIVGTEGVKHLFPHVPPGHPALHNRRYLQEWISEFPPDRLLEWCGDDAVHAINKLREHIGDRLADEVLETPGVRPWPVTVRLPEATWEHKVQWLVALFDGRVLSFAQGAEKTPTRAIAAAYILLTDAKGAQGLEARIAKARERYRKDKG
jgi:hypothetical protein